MRKTLNMSEEETKASLSNVIVNRHQIFDENDEDIDDLVEAIMLLGQEDQQREVEWMIQQIWSNQSSYLYFD